MDAHAIYAILKQKLYNFPTDMLIAYSSAFPTDMLIAYSRKENIKNEKKCRNGMPKSTQTRKDKSDGKYTKPRPYIFTLL